MSFKDRIAQQIVTSGETLPTTTQPKSQDTGNQLLEHAVTRADRLLHADPRYNQLVETIHNPELFEALEIIAQGWKSGGIEMGLSLPQIIVNLPEISVSDVAFSQPSVGTQKVSGRGSTWFGSQSYSLPRTSFSDAELHQAVTNVVNKGGSVELTDNQSHPFYETYHSFEVKVTQGPEFPLLYDNQHTPKDALPLEAYLNTLAGLIIEAAANPDSIGLHTYNPTSSTEESNNGGGY